MKRLRFGIIPKLTAVFVLFAAALLVGVGVLAFGNARSSLQAATVSELLATAIEKQAALNAWVADRQENLVSISRSAHLKDEVASLFAARTPSASKAIRDDVVEDLRNWVGAGVGFRGLLIIEPAAGLVIAATDASEEGKFKEDRPYFVNGKKGTYVQNPYYDVALQSPTLTIAAPILSSDGHLLAVLVGHLDMAEMNTIINRRTGLHRTDDAFLVNTSNLFVTQPRLATDPSVLQRGIHSEAIERCLTRNSGTVASDDYRGVPALIVYRWLPERQLCLEAKIDQEEAFAAERSLGGTLLTTGIFVLLLASALAFGLARTITRPLIALQTSTTKLGAGDLAARAPETARDELGALAREFNKMAAALEQKDKDLRQHADELAAANKELEAFSYSISHDLRAPLRAIDGFSRILLEDFGPQLADDGKRYLNLVRANTTQMGHLVDDLLAFSRLSRQPVKKQPVAVERMVKQVLEELHAEQDNRQVEISIGTLPQCEADPALLKQVYVNLIANAFKFTRTRDPARIEIGSLKLENGNWKLEGTESPPSTLQLPTSNIYYVRDNGVGFDMKYVGKLFGVFQRLHRAEEYQGTGVGLAIVQRIIHRHGGRVWAEAEVDKGATFYFTLGV